MLRHYEAIVRCVAYKANIAAATPPTKASEPATARAAAAVTTVVAELLVRDTVGVEVAVEKLVTVVGTNVVEWLLEEEEEGVLTVRTVVVELSK